ncbi:lectin-like domain-containing protein [Shouchella patagoniensis]|uniref:lectin-like domain-containing protein n=1 Tax=Shouchella patagoniensis TaxID=228576 RepID=UPI0009956376|nr:WxL domain-containing protein [Shouchella patagoniensis]
MYSSRSLRPKNLYQRMLCFTLACLLVFSAGPHMNLFVFAHETEQDVLKRTTEDAIHLGDSFELNVENAFLEADTVSILIPEGLAWVEKEEEKTVAYDPSSRELSLNDLHQTKSFSLFAETSGSFDLKATVHTEHSPEVTQTFAIHVATPQEDEEETESEPDQDETDHASEEDVVEESPNNEIEEEQNNEEPTVPEEDENESTEPEEDATEEPTQDEQPEEEQSEEETKPEDQLENDPLKEEEQETTIPKEEDHSEETKEQQEENLAEEPEETEPIDNNTERMQTMVETANVSSIPAPPVGGPNVGDLFTFAGDTNIAQHRSSNVRVLADGTRNKASAMWFNEKIDLTKSFQTTMYLYINGSSANQSQIADGLTFTMHNDSRGVGAVGQRGESLGAYGTIRGSNYSGFINHAVSFEFDTYFNGDYSDRGLANSNHTAVVIPSNAVRESGRYRMQHTNVQNRNLISNNWQPFTVSWQPRTSWIYPYAGTLTYRHGNATTTFNTNNYRTTFGSNSVYWGFTGATGDEMGLYAIAYADLPQRPRAQKQVRNVTAGESQFRTDTTAYPGDTLEYQITLDNPADNGLGAAWPNVEVTDPLPEGIQYVDNGSTDKPTRVSGNTLYFDAGTIAMAQTKKLTFRVQMKDDANGSLVNQAYAEARSGAFRGQVSSNESTVSRKAIEIHADPVAQTFPKGSNPSNWDLATFVKNINVTPSSLKQEGEVVGFSGNPPDTNQPGTYNVGIRIKSSIYPGVERVIQVPVTIVDGALSFTAPDLDFGIQTISSKPERYFGQIGNQELAITDTRHIKGHWALSLKLSSPLTDLETGTPLSADFVYKDGGVDAAIGPEETQIATGRITEGTQLVLSDSWTDDPSNEAGFFLDVAPGSAKVDSSYRAELTWTLQDVPGNE